LTFRPSSHKRSPAEGAFLLVAIASLFCPILVRAGAPPEFDYWLYVAAESADQVDLVRYGPGGFEVMKVIDVGVRPTDIDGPHGLRVSPDQEYWYMSLAHGNPFGSVHKFRTGTDQWQGAAEVGMFPSTLDVSEETGLLYVANFDLHGEMVPGTVSVVETGSMTEVARIEIGVMPHGSRLSARGDRLYGVAMMSNELVETDAWTFTVRRRLDLGRTANGDSTSPPMGMARPTWAEPSPDGRHVYVALSGMAEVLEIDIGQWEVTRRFQTAPGPYNIGVSPNGRWLVVSHRADGSTGIWDLGEGAEVARVRNSRTLTHGIAISPDSRYAFVSVEGVGAEPGAVDVIDLQASELVGTVNVGSQASGIAFWKAEPARETGP